MTVDPMLPVPAVIRGVTRETGDTFTFEVAPPAGVFAFAPGQFNMLYAFGSGEVPISISGDPARPEVLEHTIRAVGSVSRAASMPRCRARAAPCRGRCAARLHRGPRRCGNSPAVRCR